MLIERKEIQPVYGENYFAGDIGFTYSDKSIVSKGITYFTRWSKMSDIKVSHALVVLDKETCIEALAEKNCVEISPLKKYFDDKHCSIFFRKPIPGTSEIGARIAAVAKTQRGAKYDFGLIVVDAIYGTFLGHLLDGAFHKQKSKLAAHLGSDKKWICSELAAFALDEQPEIHGKGILSLAESVITPQALFEDDLIFKSWKHTL